MLIDSEPLKKSIEERKAWISRFWFGKSAARELDLVRDMIEKLEQAPEITDLGVYDQCEEFENCTVQVLTNRYTGDVSVGWWQDTAEEIRSS